MNSVVVYAAPPISDNRVDIWPEEFLSIRKQINREENMWWSALAPTAFNYKIIDQSQNSEKLMTIEALHVSRRKPQLNTRDEYKSRELTLKY